MSGSRRGVLQGSRQKLKGKGRRLPMSEAHVSLFDDNGTRFGSHGLFERRAGEVSHCFATNAAAGANIKYKD